MAVKECGLTIHEANSVVFCARSGILRHTFPVSVMKCQGTINQDLRVLETTDSIDPEFLMYYLRGMNATIQYDVSKTYDIIAKNRFNQTPLIFTCPVCRSINEYTGSYISFVDEDSFLSDPSGYIENAYSKSQNISNYNIRKTRYQ